MKRDRLFSAFSGIDDAFVDESRPKREKKKNRFIRIGALVACLAILCVWLFVPFQYNPEQQIAKYRGSEYYPVIHKLNTYLSKPPKYKNNFQKLVASFEVGKGDMMMPDAGADMNEAAGGSFGSKYEEVTDNQVSGVIEADLIKRTSTHFFYLDGTKIKVYSIAGEASTLVSTFDIARPADAGYVYLNTLEFYLSTDAKRLSVIYPYTHKTLGSAYDIISLNVEHPEEIRETTRTTVTGAYKSSRLVNGKLLVIGEYYVSANPDYGKEETFLPRVDVGEGFQSVPMDNIIAPDQVVNSRYNVITKYDEGTLALEDTLAVLSYSDILYVSQNAIYLTRRYNETAGEEPTRFTVTKSDILRVDYTGEKFLPCGTATVEGYLENQYSLDEYEGTLRVVTTTSRNRIYESDWHSGVDLSPDPIFALGTSASLYLIQLEDMQTVASVEHFAPLGERVRSVRFDGTNAYVCTAIQNTDPVFFFDLSNPQNITYKDTGTISGFSTSLIQMGNGFLLGIGQGDGWDTVKVEVYEESENGVVSVAKYEIQGAEYTNFYKSYLVDRENGLFGFGYTDYNSYGSYGKYSDEYYVVLHFDGYHLHEIAKVELPGHASCRAVHIDGTLYFFGNNTFFAQKITE